MFKLIGNQYINVEQIVFVSSKITEKKGDGEGGFYVFWSYTFKQTHEWRRFNTFEEAVVVFTQLLEAIGVPQEQIEKHVEESRQKIEEQEGG